MPENNPKSLGRVPVMPLSYDQRERAVTKELIADYETGNIYIKNANGELINVFQAALKVDNQWLTTTARLNNGRSWPIVVGTVNNALAAGGMGTEATKILDTVEAWDGSVWKVDSTEDFGVIEHPNASAGCGTKDSMLFAGWAAMYKYENGTATVLNTDTARCSHSKDMVGNSTQALMRIFTGAVYSYNSITKAFSSIGSVPSSTQNICEESFGTANGAIFISCKEASNIVTKYDGTNFITMATPNIYRNRFGSSGENTTSGIIFGGMTVGYAQSMQERVVAEEGTNTSEEWINGILWKVSSNMEYGICATDGCGSSTGGLSTGGFLLDGSLSTYTQRFNNVDGLTYLKSIRDDMSAIIDAISDKTIGSTFDSFLSTNAIVGDYDIAGMPGVGTKQTKATIENSDGRYSYSTLTKNLTTLESWITLLEGSNKYIFTSGNTDDAPDYIVSQDRQNSTTKLNGVTESTISFNPFFVYDSASYINMESTGGESGIGRTTDSGRNKPPYFKYDFSNLTSSSLISPLIDRAGGFGGGNGTAVAYFIGGRTHTSSVYYTNAEKIENNNVKAIGNSSAYHFTMNKGQANLMKYGNDFIAYGSVIEKLNTLTDTWSTESYKSAYASNYAIANGNASAFGLGAAIVSGVGICFEELFHGGVIDTVEKLLSDNSTNINTKTAEQVDTDSEEINIGYIAGTKDGLSTPVMISTEELFKILCENIPENIADYTGFTQKDIDMSNLVYKVLYDVYDYDDYYEVEFMERFDSIYSVDATIGDRLRSLENVLIRLLFGTNPLYKQFGQPTTYGADNAKISSDFNIRNVLNDILTSGNDHAISLLSLVGSHVDGYSHPKASTSQAGYMSNTHYTLLADATDSASANALIKRDANGKALIVTPPYSSSYNTYYIANCNYVYKYFIRNSTAQLNNSVVQYIGTRLQVPDNNYYTERQVRNIVFWTSGAIPTTYNGDIIIKTF